MLFQLASSTEDTISDRLATETNDYRAFSRLSLLVLFRPDAMTALEFVCIMFVRPIVWFIVSMISWFLDVRLMLLEVHYRCFAHHRKSQPRFCIVLGINRLLMIYDLLKTELDFNNIL